VEAAIAGLNDLAGERLLLAIAGGDTEQQSALNFRLAQMPTVRKRRSERVPQDMNTDAAKICPPCRSGDQSLNESLIQRTTVIGTQHATAFQVSMLP